jgi:hypothetical protein
VFATESPILLRFKPTVTMVPVINGFDPHFTLVYRALFAANNERDSYLGTRRQLECRRPVPVVILYFGRSDEEDCGAGIQVNLFR